jgi:hypothetical protein
MFTVEKSSHRIIGYFCNVQKVADRQKFAQSGRPVPPDVLEAQNFETSRRACVCTFDAATISIRLFIDFENGGAVGRRILEWLDLGRSGRSGTRVARFLPDFCQTGSIHTNKRK